MNLRHPELSLVEQIGIQKINLADPIDNSLSSSPIPRAVQIEESVTRNSLQSFPAGSPRKEESKLVKESLNLNPVPHITNNKLKSTITGNYEFPFPGPNKYALHSAKYPVIGPSVNKQAFIPQNLPANH